MAKVTSQHNLSVLHPKLAQEWHPSNNGKITPRDVGPGFTKKVWWCCEKGHEWQARPADRIDGTDCPYCGNRKVCEDNCLAVVNPQLATEWHPIKNGALTPKDVVPGFTKKVWWQCKQGHEWEAIPRQRSLGSGCPCCAKRKVCKENCLAVVNPKLASEWHPTRNGPLTPEEVTPNSARKVWWQCKKGHEWKVGPNGRSSGQKCPFCSNRKACEDNCLATVNPKLASEWHPSKNGSLTPEDVTPGSAKRVWWQCKRNHVWKVSVGNRTRRYGCPYCYFQISSVELRIYTELKSIFEDIKQKEKISGAECDIYIPSLKIGIEYDGEYWHRNKTEKDLEKNSLFKRSGITFIRIRELPLPKIAQEDIQFNYSKDDKLGLIKIILKRFQETLGLDEIQSEKINSYLERTNFANDEYFLELQELLPSPREAKSLAFLNPSLASEWHPTRNGKLNPENVTLKSGTSVWWLCKKGHEWKVKIQTRSKGNGCPYCGNKRVCIDNCLATVSPRIASEWHPTKNGKLTPKDVQPFSNVKVWWLCEKGHEWHVAPNGRSRGNNCPYCVTRSSRVTSETSLAAKNPRLSSEWHPTKNGPLTPLNVMPGSHNKVWWQCPKGHEWEANVTDRSNGNGCPFCSGLRVTKETSLAAKKLHLVQEWHPTKNGSLTPGDVMPFSGKKVWWQCKQGHEWEAAISKRSNGHGCPYCSGKRVSIAKSLGSQKPHLAQEWHPTKNKGLTPMDVMPGTHQMIWWQCKRGHEWESAPHSRSRGLGCPYCANKKVCNDNSLATKYPLIASEWHPSKNGKLTPEDVLPFSHKKIWWLCKHGHEWEVFIYHRSGGRGCPYCGGRRATKETS